MKVFLSYTYGDDVSVIKQIIQSYDLEIFDSLQEDYVANSLQLSIKSAISSCDCFVCVYTAPIPSVLFEAGIAVALNKPIFSILNGEEGSAYLLHDSTYVRAQPMEYEKIKFSLDLFLQHISNRRTATPVVLAANQSMVYYGGGEAIPWSKDYNIRDAYAKALINGSGEALESFFQEIFVRYDVSVVKSPLIKENPLEPDFSIWVDELWPILGNPIMVEIKKGLDPKRLNIIKDRYLDVKNNNFPGGLLILYGKLDGISKQELPNVPFCMFIQIDDLVKELEGAGFSTAIKNIKNKIYYNQEHGRILK